MKNRLRTIPGTPKRVRVQQLGPSGLENEHKLDSDARFDEVVPTAVRIEVGGGRSSGASAMRAARVRQEVEDVGGGATAVDVEGERATLEAEVDRRQVLHLVRLPFVRRVSVS